MLNPSKTQCMFVGSRGLLSQGLLDVKIQVDGNFIIPCKSVKNLEIYFDNFMLFDTHISEMSKKIYGTVMYINRIRDNFNKNTRIPSLALPLPASSRLISISSSFAFPLPPFSSLSSFYLLQLILSRLA